VWELLIVKEVSNEKNKKKLAPSRENVSIYMLDECMCSPVNVFC